MNSNNISRDSHGWRATASVLQLVTSVLILIVAYFGFSNGNKSIESHLKDVERQRQIEVGLEQLDLLRELEQLNADLLAESGKKDLSAQKTNEKINKMWFQLTELDKELMILCKEFGIDTDVQLHDATNGQWNDLDAILADTSKKSGYSDSGTKENRAIDLEINRIRIRNRISMKYHFVKMAFLQSCYTQSTSEYRPSLHQSKPIEFQGEMGLVDSAK